jgi:hypothetical protein
MDDKRSRWEQCRRQLEVIRALPEDWDDAGARTISSAIVDCALELLNRWLNEPFAMPSRVVPSPTGSVVLEWQVGNLYSEAEVTDPYTIEWMTKIGDLPPEHSVEKIMARPAGRTGFPNDMPIMSFRSTPAPDDLLFAA